MKNNYGVYIYFRGRYYTAEFPEYWLALVFANAIKENTEVEKVYMLERFSADELEITRRIK